jgi:hypothetical protein
MCLLGCTTFLKGNECQKKVEEGCNLSCRFRSISRKPFNGFQPYYTHMIPTCPRCAFWGVRPSEGQTKVGEGCNLSCSFRSISRKPSNGFQPYYIRMIPTCPRCAFWGAQPSEGQNKVVTVIPLQTIYETREFTTCKVQDCPFTCSTAVD